MSELAVDAQHLKKTFTGWWLSRQAVEALRGVTLSVPRGMIFGLLGPNGAGKTTLLSILATLLLPDSGSASVLGLDVLKSAAMIRRRVNMASGNANFPWSLRPPEILAFYGRLYGLHGRSLRLKVDELMAVCELESHRKTPYNELSTGFKQRLALAKSLVNDPELLFLDEPTLGLDPDISIRIRRQIASLRSERGTTILLTTHYMREAEELCDEIAFIKKGLILARGSAHDLKERFKVGEVIALTLDPGPWNSLGRLPGVLRCVAADRGVECTVDSVEKRLPEILKFLHEQGAAIRGVKIHEPDLEEVFVELAR